MADKPPRPYPPKGVCRYFGKPGGCRFGDRCIFRHETLTTVPEASRTRRSVPIGMPDISAAKRRKFEQWLLQTPENMPAIGLGSRLAFWVTTARELVEDTVADHRQQVVQRLCTEGGVARIIEVLEAVPAAPITPRAGERLGSSGGLEIDASGGRFDQIHNLLYGTGGRRAIAFFTAISQIFEAFGDDAVAHVDTLCVAIAVLMRVVDLNGGAKLNEGFATVVHCFEGVLSLPVMEQSPKVIRATHVLRRVAGILEIGLALPHRDAKTIPVIENLASFHIDRALPGSLRDEGPRHDNDHVDIADIEIMPTESELGSHDNEYLPVNDPRSLHLSGLEGLLDRQYRLLREDTVGQMRDAVCFEMEQLRRAHSNQPYAMAEHRGTRVIVHRGVVLEDFVLGRDHLAIRFSFKQPPNLRNKSKAERQAWWESSRSLMEDSLVCLLGPDGFAAFLSVCHDPKKPGMMQAQTYPISFFEDPNRATTFVKLVQPHQMSFKVDACLRAQKRQNLVLCEFPGVLLAAFYHTLDALKMMSKKLDMPFANILAPSSTVDEMSGLDDPPLYARGPGFKFDLGSLIDDRDTLDLEIGPKFDFELLSTQSTLDDAQQQALVDALRKRFALIQGPPGCGKSFTGVALIKVLLANKRKANLGPLVCVCYTNHALDQLLEHLVSGGVKQVIRMGGQSKSEVLKTINIRQVARGVQATRTEGRQVAQLRGSLETLSKLIGHDIAFLKTEISLDALSSFLQQGNATHFTDLQSFEKEQIDAQGFQVVDQDKRPAIEKWLRPRCENLVPERSNLRSPEQLQSVSLSQMTLAERGLIYGLWQDAIRNERKALLVEHLNDHNRDTKALQACYRERDLRCLQQANVIGLTTSGLAKNLDLLRCLPSKVMLCEEAGEVLEAHMICSLLPSVEHTILIGDHEQLRPQIQNYELQSTNPRGVQYSLDISLFERLINPPFPHMPRLQYSTLDVQRRMHPSISNLIRHTLYPRLQDHHSVFQHPAVPGMSKRLFWLDHQHAEEPKDQARSHSNTFEVHMVAAVVSHLVRQCQYKSDDIAVLTPYLGQLQKLRKHLSSMFEIVIDDRDAVELQEQGLHDDVVAHNPQLASRSSLIEALRLATVDNFQGEEAQVVVVSLVRSNEKKKCGFLKTTNRTNVLLSRAQHGMYLIGDSSCYEGEPMWAQVIQMLRDGGNFGTSIPLACPRHPNTPIYASTADDFARFAPEGGCSLQCEERLGCGHQCPTKCHAKALHEAVVCQEECLRPRKGCIHLCQKACGVACGKCEVPIQDVLLPCGHISSYEKCYITQDLSLAKCQVSVEREIPDCYHRILLPCHIKVDDSTRCTAGCAVQLKCQHRCLRRCHECRRCPGDEATVDHGSCQAECGNDYSLCGHHCKQRCHRGKGPQSDCRPCSAKCQTCCRHSQCSKACCEPCAPCAEQCRAGCEHTEVCKLPCAAPCDILPCSRRCDHLLGCGHRCPSVCGEICPDQKYCQACGDLAILNQSADWIGMLNYRDIDLNHERCYFLACGHILTMTTLDHMMEMENFYQMEENGRVIALKGPSEPFTAKVVQCPECRYPVQNLQRYNRIWRRALLDESTKKFIAWSSKAFAPLSEAVDLVEEQLGKDKEFGLGTQDARFLRSDDSQLQQLSLSGSFDDVIVALTTISELKARYSSSLYYRKRIHEYLLKVTEEEQPVGRVRDMLRSAKRQCGEKGPHSNALLDNTVLQCKHRLLATSLSIRCDLVILTDFFSLRRAHAQIFTGKYD